MYFDDSDHGQGGAQGIEDGLALGLVMNGVTDASQIEERLALYEKIRRNRASSIQVLSNFPYDESPPPELAEFLEGQPVPGKPWVQRRKQLAWLTLHVILASMGDMVKLAYCPDVVKRVTQTMTDFDPNWKLPEEFFSAAPPWLETNDSSTETPVVPEESLSDATPGIIHEKPSIEVAEILSEKPSVAVQIGLEEISEGIKTL